VSDRRAVRRDVQSCARDGFYISIDLHDAAARRRRVRVVGRGVRVGVARP
jgi:hypothetical protein